ncbi:phage holin family protein [Citrobacter portucalensis]|uniref:phage holin family protein n=1 Tax=Citrobacter portucalensis TaxID=1639133 RepID=UPI0015801277|nr:phage holin family protein [Citrobacter portucalensis]NUH56536.1 phage holin family protein [Citrobacter portucalensis]
MLSNPPGLLNVALCTVIVLALFFYRRKNATHKPLVSWLAWLLMLVYAIAPLRFLFGQVMPVGWGIVLANLVFCVLVVWARGNVSKLLSLLRL